MHEEPIARRKSQLAPLLGYGENLMGETHCSTKNQTSVAARIRESVIGEKEIPNKCLCYEAGKTTR
jgi:hypothetical protein